MSAFEVPVEHINALLTAGLVLAEPGSPVRWYWPPVDADTDRGHWTSAQLQEQGDARRRDLTVDTAGRVGAMLLAENWASVNHRYDEHEIEAPYLFTRMPGRPDPVVVLKLLSCYEYQSCEHPGWVSSEAAEFCDTLRRQAISVLPGYRQAPWLVSDRDIFTASH